jgi:hypothetical protein
MSEMAVTVARTLPEVVAVRVSEVVGVTKPAGFCAV